MPPSNNFDKIEDLIERTEDPVQRAVLVVLSGIARELDTNTKATESLANSFQGHRDDFVKHDQIETRERHYIRGALWAGAVFLGIVQSFGGWLVYRAVTMNDQQDSIIQVLDKRLAVLETVVKSHIELYLKAMEKLP